MPRSPSAGGCGRQALCSGMATAAGVQARTPRPLRLLLLLLRVLPAWCATAWDTGATPRRSLDPPYFNLAEAARIWATATCGERGRGDGGGRPTPELYCKLVGGPTAQGSGHAIQVSFPSESRPGQGGSGCRWWASQPGLRVHSPRASDYGHKEGLRDASQGHRGVGAVSS